VYRWGKRVTGARLSTGRKKEEKRGERARL